MKIHIIKAHPLSMEEELNEFIKGKKVYTIKYILDNTQLIAVIHYNQTPSQIKIENAATRKELREEKKEEQAEELNKFMGGYKHGR